MKTHGSVSRSAAAATLGVGLIFAGCGQSVGVTATEFWESSAVLEPGDTITYELATFDTEPVPVELPFGGSIVAGSMTFAGDGTCDRTLVVSDDDPDAPTETESSWACAWERDGDDVTLTWAGPPSGSTLEAASATTAVVEGDRLTLVIDTGIVCVTTPCPTHWAEVYEAEGA